MENNDVVSTLNDLIQTSRDGEEGFRDCAKNAKDPQLKSLLENRAQSCGQAVRELQQCVTQYGGKPEDSSSMSGTMHRRWLDVKTAFTSNDDAAVLSECERGEDVALESYRNALGKSLPQDVMSVVEKQYQGVKRNHDQIRTLRDQAKARS
ncbi:MAG: PA2169 family four-helix-bundle protein [Burkholderiaceae bacterium]